MSKPIRILLNVALFTIGTVVIIVLLVVLLSFLLVGPSAGMRKQAQKVRASADLKIIAEALTKFRKDNQRWPTEAEGLDLLIRSPNGPYIKYLSDFTDPWGQRIRYRVSSDGTISVSSLGADKKTGGTGPDSDIVVTVNITATQPNSSATTRSTY